MKNCAHQTKTSIHHNAHKGFKAGNYTNEANYE